jgi:hypothetical protein
MIILNGDSEPVDEAPDKNRLVDNVAALRIKKYWWLVLAYFIGIIFLVYYS